MMTASFGELAPEGWFDRQKRTTKRFPIVAGEWRKPITITHALPKLGYPHPHEHQFIVRFGWKHEINPGDGYTWSLESTQAKVNAILSAVDGKDLNTILPVPTAEHLALWLLEKAPLYYGYVAIECYDGYTVRADRK